MCEIFEINRSSFYRWNKSQPNSKRDRRAFIFSEISRIFNWSQGRYGGTRITKELHSIGIKISRGYVGRLLQRLHLQKVSKLKFKKTTNSFHKYPVVDNLLNQDFKVKKENEVWVSDITYVRTGQGWLYLTIVIDLFDRKVIGWSASETMKAIDTSIAAYKKSVLHRPLTSSQKLIFHSDRGIQYACKDFVYIITKNSQISRSMSRKGNCYDNAVAESFFKTLKTELISKNNYTSRRKAKTSISEYIENFYNTERRHSALGNFTITEYHNLKSK
ncbi:integrase [Flavobacterium sp. Root186]|nr:integrase [Flavobacterium sp. Root186]